MTPTNTAAASGATASPQFPTHPEPHVMDWTGLEISAIAQYGREMYAAGQLAALAAPAQAVPIDAIRPEIQATLATLDVPVVGYLSSHSGALHDSASKVPRFESAIPLVRESDHRRACEKIMAVLTTAALTAAPAQARKCAYCNREVATSVTTCICRSTEFGIAAAPAQAGEYPELPNLDSSFAPFWTSILNWRDTPPGKASGDAAREIEKLVAEQMRAYVDADRAARGAAQAAPVAWRYHCEGDPVKWYFSDTPSLLGLYQPLYAAAQAAPVDADVQTLIDSAPEPFRRLGEFLARTLDEDQWATAQHLLLGGLVAVQEGRDIQSEIDHYNENMG